MENKNGYFYSITRCDGLNRQTYAERKAEKYKEWAKSAKAKSASYFAASNEGRSFLSLGEPIKIGHHSEKRHRALIERNWVRMGNAVAFDKKAEDHCGKAAYWESRTNDIDLSMPESIEYFAYKLEKAKRHHTGLLDGSIARAHGMSLQYSSKNVKELNAKYLNALKLWG